MMNQNICIVSSVLTDIARTDLAKAVKDHLVRCGRNVALVGIEAYDKALGFEDNKMLTADEIFCVFFEEVNVLCDGVTIVDTSCEFFFEMARAGKSFRVALEREFDLFLAPITQTTKADDMMCTVSDLVDRGIDTSKIKILFNRAEIERSDNLKEDFSELIAYAKNNDIQIWDSFIHLSKLIEANCEIYTEIKAKISEAKRACNTNLAMTLGGIRVDGKRASVDAAAYDRVFNEIPGE